MALKYTWTLEKFYLSSTIKIKISFPTFCLKLIKIKESWFTAIVTSSSVRFWFHGCFLRFQRWISENNSLHLLQITQFKILLLFMVDLYLANEVLLNSRKKSFYFRKEIIPDPPQLFETNKKTSARSKWV